MSDNVLAANSGRVLTAHHECVGALHDWAHAKRNRHRHVCHMA